MSDESDEWISATEAIKLVAAAIGVHQAPRAICSRAHAGLIKARAARLIVGEHIFDDEDIPEDFWWASDEAALQQDWRTGDFETWIDKGIDERLEMKAFGVSFSRHGIETLIAPAVANRDAQPPTPTHPGGRPPAEWWDDLWVEICRQLYEGDLQPKKQADIERAMMDWASKRGHQPSEGSIRPRARKLWTALQNEGKN